MKLSVDLDNTICFGMPYKKAKPNIFLINKINELYEKGNIIIIFTARRERDRHLTKYWLRKFNVKHHKLIMGKPKCDYYVDDRNMSMEDFMNLQ